MSGKRGAKPPLPRSREGNESPVSRGLQKVRDLLDRKEATVMSNIMMGRRASRPKISLMP
ncbi:hypothetical protein A45J_0160 [hot springs metagenome]|uniref:Uncharacterized protein n=1 Tax=hot springs metagenome TaxID=433727 RepID=A0A5J4KT35_9ZZZZ